MYVVLLEKKKKNYLNLVYIIYIHVTIVGGLFINCNDRYYSVRSVMFPFAFLLDKLSHA